MAILEHFSTGGHHGVVVIVLFAALFVNKV